MKSECGVGLWQSIERKGCAMAGCGGLRRVAASYGRLRQVTAGIKQGAAPEMQEVMALISSKHIFAGGLFPDVRHRHVNVECVKLFAR